MVPVQVTETPAKSLNNSQLATSPLAKGGSGQGGEKRGTMEIEK